MLNSHEKWTTEVYSFTNVEKVHKYASEFAKIAMNMTINISSKSPLQINIGDINRRDKIV